MSDSITIISEYLAIWMPSITAILSMVTVFLIIVSKIKNAIDEFKKDDVIKQLTSELKESMKVNAEIREQYDILVDEIKKIKNYRENKRR